MVYSYAFVTLGLCVAAVISDGPAMALPPDPRRPQPLKQTPQQWPVEHWVLLAPAEHVDGTGNVMLPPALDGWVPVPEQIIVKAPRHVDDSAPLIMRIDASNPHTLDAAQPVVRNLQTVCEDKGLSSTICFDMTQVPLRTQLLRFRSILFGD